MSSPSVSLRDIPKILHRLTPGEQERLLAELDRLEKLKNKKLCTDRFMPFVKEVWPTFIGGRHHQKMANAFERVARGECKRLIINMGPRHTKSEFASYLLPAWFLGKFPHKKVIQCSHTAELAVGFGRKVRNLVDTDTYHELFPDLSLASDSKAAGRWNTSKQGDYFAIGVGGAVTGKGADLLIIDDPHSEQEAALAEVNPDIYDKTYEWYTSGPRQRLQPGGAIVIVMCMTGDTPVLRPDGSETPLKDLRVGDAVATYEGGELTTSRVTNFQSNGFDDVFTVKTQSGIAVKANERHPFLVEHDGVRKWARLRDLTPGMSLVRARDVTAPQGHSASPDCATHAKPAQPTTARTLTRHTNPWATTASGRARRALAVRLFTALVSACRATENSTPLRSILLSRTALDGSSIATASLWANTNAWSPYVKIAATSADTRLPLRTRVRIGMASCASTIAMTLARCVDFCATTATSLWDMVNPQKPLSAPQLIYEFTADPIVEITPAGREEVFDVEIERTENFIANGLVAHNTRWSKRDLTGQILKDAAANDSLGEWEVIEFPAILPSGNPLWPEFWSVDELLKVKRDVPNSKWMAQYMQNPVSESAAIVKREWWKTWDEDDPPHCDFILQSWDTAFEKTQRADYSACTTWGVFYRDSEETGLKEANIILLNAFRDRMEFPTLKKRAIEEYREWSPDSVIIEKKASGAPLIYEMRSMGIPVQDFTPTRGNDKISRLNAVADVFASGQVWAPATRWAEEVIDEVAEFPAGSHDDYVDTVSMAMHRFRRGGYLTLPSDEPDEVRYFKSHTKRGYY